MSALPPQITKLIPVLASANDSEVLAVRDAIGRLLVGAGLDWHDLAASCRLADIIVPVQIKPARPDPSIAQMAWACRHLDRGTLSAAERAFVVTMSTLRFGRAPTQRQHDWLRGIYDRLSARRAA